jgi:hypothetical protein
VTDTGPGESAAVVSVHLWDLPTRRIPSALWHVALDRGPGHRPDTATFTKLLGTGSGSTFTPRDADLHRWALVATWPDRDALERGERAPLLRGWRDRAARTSRLVLRPLSSRGRWSGREPFGAPVPVAWSGQVAALTRARLRIGTARSFWRAVPPVSGALHGSPGLIFAIGIGEAPVGLQGTLSIWQDAAALRGFAYAGAAHRDVVARTAGERWYAEELFARFGVLEADPLFLGGAPAG